jgi:hypothetical protein
LKQSYPGRTLDLSELRGILSELETRPEEASENRLSAVTSNYPTPDRSSTSTRQQPEAANTAAQEGISLDEVTHLHEDLGCLLRDPTGEYRTSQVSSLPFSH